MGSLTQRFAADLVVDVGDQPTGDQPPGGTLERSGYRGEFPPAGGLTARAVVRSTTGAPGSALYRALQNETMSYRRYSFAK